MTARRHAQDPDGEPVDAGKPAAVAAKAAAIDAVQARPLTWKIVVKRALGGAGIYLVLSKLMAVLGAWPPAAGRRNSTGRTSSPQRCMSPGPSGTPAGSGA